MLEPSGFKKITEQASHYDHLDKMSVGQILSAINREDQGVPSAVAEVLPAIELLIEKIIGKMEAGGRLFYLGAGTSGRLGILDASECPPTFGVASDRVIGLIAGGDTAIRSAVEFAEDDRGQGWLDLKKHNISDKDIVVGIAASGTTPYVVQALGRCNEQGILTAGICCNPGSPLAETAKHPIVVVVGPEFVTGSSRMKAGTAQKLVLNMISTATMIRLGHVKGNRMVDMQLGNQKLVKRGIRMVREVLGVSESVAIELLKKHGSVRKAIEGGK